MRRATIAILSASILFPLSAGCGVRVTPDTTLAELLNQITVGDVTNLLQNLRPLLGPRPHRGPPLPDYLQLTEEQREQAREIHQQAHEDIRRLHEDAHDALLAVLTDEQRAEFEELMAQRPHPRPDGGPGMFFGRPGPRPFEVPLMPPVDGDAAGAREGRFEMPVPPPPGGPGGPRHGPRPFGPPPLARVLLHLADELELTEDQIAQIETLRDDLHEAVRARHERAREEFRAILTPEQLQRLEEWESQHRPPGPPPAGAGMPAAELER